MDDDDWVEEEKNVNEISHYGDELSMIKLKRKCFPPMDIHRGRTAAICVLISFEINVSSGSHYLIRVIIFLWLITTVNRKNKM